jgi:predicted Zn-dependent protease with MMP-like domain
MVDEQDALVVHRDRAAGGAEHAALAAAAAGLVGSARGARLARYRDLQRRYRPDRRQFEALVAEALAAIPPEFQRRLRNVAVVVEDWPSAEQRARHPGPVGGTLFGLYEGTPLPSRGDYHLAVPDRIVVFRGPILAACADRAETVREVRDTVIHEIGHFFGLPEEELP